MSKEIHGIMAEFDTAAQLIVAARQTREAGFIKTDAFSPYPLHEIDAALGIKKSILPYMIFAGGVMGLLGGLALVTYVHVIDYPIIVGGRPHFSLPAFIPPLFELTILGAAVTAVFGMLFLNGLPQPYHPVFNVPRFALASREKFFLVIEAKDPQYDHAATTKFMEGLGAQEVFDVPE